MIELTDANTGQRVWVNPHAIQIIEHGVTNDGMLRGAVVTVGIRALIVTENAEVVASLFEIASS